MPSDNGAWQHMMQAAGPFCPHTHTHTHTHTHLCYGQWQALVSWMAPLFSCLPSCVHHANVVMHQGQKSNRFLSSHFMAIILLLHMTIASPFFSFRIFSSSGIFFQLTLTVPTTYVSASNCF
jgi:hypothetical protein